MKKTVGVLALQGAFAKHLTLLQSLDVQPIAVRTPQELSQCDALIIPGGESSTIFKQLKLVELVEPLKQFASQKPVMGTCAGAVLLAKEVQGNSAMSFGLIDITVVRNGYGRQLESFTTSLQLLPPFSSRPLVFPGIFIRAPRIKQWGEKVTVLATLNQDPVFVRQGKCLAISFHPELTEDPSIHRYFIDLIKSSA